jgi:glycosyltransferase involved in cell wall biosynthesis
MLTIGIPFYNNEKTLPDAVKSVLIQTYTDWELILADDGSEDNSLEIARQFAAQDKRIKLTSDGVNRGLIYRLNQIIDLAQGEYIARMDSDDMMMPGKLAKQMEVLKNDNSIDVIDTAAYIINENNEPTGMRGLTDLSTWDRRRTFKDVLLFHPTVVAKTSWYRKNKYDKDFVRSEDFELWCRTFNHTVFARVYEPLFLYREGRVNISNYVKSNQSYRKILRNHGKEVLSGTEITAEIIKSHLKSFLYRIFSWFNMQHFLSSKRNLRINIQQQKEVRAIIARIKNFECHINS